MILSSRSEQTALFASGIEQRSRVLQACKTDELVPRPSFATAKREPREISVLAVLAGGQESLSKIPMYQCRAVAYVWYMNINSLFIIQ